MPLKRPIYSVALLVDYVREQGGNVNKLLADTGIQTDDLNNHDMMISIGQEMAVMKNLVSLIPNPRTGLEMAQNAPLSANARITIPAMFCRTFLDAILLMFRYIEISLAHFQYELFVENNLAFLRMKELINFGDLRRFIFELELSAILSISKIILGEPLVLKKINIAYPKPEYASFYQELFRCPCSFDADDHMIIFDSSHLYRRLPHANALAKDEYEKECKRAYDHLSKQGTTLEKVHHELFILGKDIPPFKQLASQLNMSPRTLRRHLKAEGTSYKALSISAYISITKAHTPED